MSALKAPARAVRVTMSYRVVATKAVVAQTSVGKKSAFLLGLQSFEHKAVPDVVHLFARMASAFGS